MSAKIIFITIFSLLAFSAISLIITAKNLLPQAIQFTSDVSQVINNLPTPSASTASPSAIISPQLTPMPSKPAPSPTDQVTKLDIDASNSVNSHSCYKITINGTTYEECSENGNLNFHYSD